MATTVRTACSIHYVTASQVWGLGMKGSIRETSHAVHSTSRFASAILLPKADLARGCVSRNVSLLWSVKFRDRKN